MYMHAYPCKRLKQFCMGIDTVSSRSDIMSIYIEMYVYAFVLVHHVYVHIYIQCNAAACVFV